MGWFNKLFLKKAFKGTLVLLKLYFKTLIMFFASLKQEEKNQNTKCYGNFFATLSPDYWKTMKCLF